MEADPEPIVSVGPPVIKFVTALAAPVMPRLPAIVKFCVLVAGKSRASPRTTGAEIRFTEPATPPLVIVALAALLLRIRLPPLLDTLVVTALVVPPKLIPPTVMSDAPTSVVRLVERPMPRFAVSSAVVGAPVLGNQLFGSVHDCVPPAATFHT